MKVARPAHIRATPLATKRNDDRRATQSGACARRRRDRHQRRQPRAAAARRRLGGRRPVPPPDGLDQRITPLAADLLDADAVAAAVRGTAPTHVFFTTWSRRATEAENMRRQRAHAREPPRGGRRGEIGAPRRARHRAEALSRAVRGVREGAAGHAVLRGAAAPARTRTSTTCRRTSSSPPRSATGSRGPCTGRTP